MHPIDPHLLRDLLLPRPGPCLSLFLPLTAFDPDGHQARIRWKNLLRKAALGLTELAVDARSADQILAEARDLDPLQFVPDRRDEGLAVWVARGFLRTHPLGIEPHEGVIVGDRFHVKPLLATLDGADRFHVLALSQNQVRLIEATPRRAVEVPVPGCPESLAEALKYDEHEPVQQMHGTSAGNAQRPTVAFHGQGGSVDPHKDELLRFCRQVAGAVGKTLHEDSSPLVVACVDYVFPIYQEANKHPTLVGEFVRGNPDRVRAEELAERAWELVRDRFQEQERAESRRFQALAGTGRTCASVEEVLAAATEGRVETLFLAIDQAEWGRYDASRRLVARHERPGPGDLDLLDLAAAEALEHGATVRVLPEERLPTSAHAAAILRY